jgi:hypothetical protein
MQCLLWKLRDRRSGMGMPETDRARAQLELSPLNTMICALNRRVYIVSATTATIATKGAIVALMALSRYLRQPCLLVQVRQFSHS